MDERESTEKHGAVMISETFLIKQVTQQASLFVLTGGGGHGAVGSWVRALDRGAAGTRPTALINNSSLAQHCDCSCVTTQTLQHIKRTLRTSIPSHRLNLFVTDENNNVRMRNVWTIN